MTGRNQRTRRAVLDHRGDPMSAFALPGGALAAVGIAAILSPFRETAFGNTNAALVLVVVVAAAASAGGPGAGATAAVTAALTPL